MATDSSQAIELFLCYAHKDEELRQSLEKQLRALRRQGLIDIWHDRQIHAGAEWEGEINKHLNTAQIILLLISPDFMDSDYCYGVEMRRAMDRHQSGEAHVIPIILRPVYWQGAPFGKIQALPTDAIPVVSRNWHSQDEAFYDIIQGIRIVIDKLISQRLPVITTSAEESPPSHLPHQQQEEELESNEKQAEAPTSQHLDGTNSDDIIIKPNHEKVPLSSISVQSVTKQTTTESNESISNPIAQELDQDEQTSEKVTATSFLQPPLADSFPFFSSLYQEKQADMVSTDLPKETAPPPIQAQPMDTPEKVAPPPAHAQPAIDPMSPSEKLAASIVVSSIEGLRIDGINRFRVVLTCGFLCTLGGAALGLLFNEPLSGLVLLIGAVVGGYANFVGIGAFLAEKKWRWLVAMPCIIVIDFILMVIGTKDIWSFIVIGVSIFVILASPLLFFGSFDWKKF